MLQRPEPPGLTARMRPLPSTKVACITGILWAHGPENFQHPQTGLLQARIFLVFSLGFHGGKVRCVIFSKANITSTFTSMATKTPWHRKCLPLRGRKTNITVGPERLLQDQQRPCVLAARNFEGSSSPTHDSLEFGFKVYVLSPRKQFLTNTFCKFQIKIFNLPIHIMTTKGSRQIKTIIRIRIAITSTEES